MDAFNLTLFHAIAAGTDPHPLHLAIASAMSSLSGSACLALLAWTAWRRPGRIGPLLGALTVCGVVSLVARDLALMLDVARPVMRGLSPQHVPHGWRPGLPSTHASAMFALAFMVVALRGLRHAGAALLAIAALTAWSRVYLGLHFPADIAAGVLLGAVATLASLVPARMIWRRAARFQLQPVR